MSVILIFVVFVLVGDTAAVCISYLFERISNFTSLMVFFALFIAGVRGGLEAGGARDRALHRPPAIDPRQLTASKVMLMPVAWLDAARFR